MMADEILKMPASAEPQVHDLLRRRWSPRAFAQQPVEPTKIGSVLEGALGAVRRQAAARRTTSGWQGNHHAG
jgi:hypothetical protein